MKIKWEADPRYSVGTFFHVIASFPLSLLISQIPPLWSFTAKHSSSSVHIHSLPHCSLVHAHHQWNCSGQSVKTSSLPHLVDMLASGIWSLCSISTFEQFPTLWNSLSTAFFPFPSLPASSFLPCLLPPSLLPFFPFPVFPFLLFFYLFWQGQLMVL